MMKSDAAIVAMNVANKGVTSPAESQERRAAPEEKSTSPCTHRTQERARVSSGTDRLRQFVRRNPQVRLTTLLHHINIETLRSAFHSLRKDAAAGADGMTWQRYAVGLEDRLIDLHDRVHSGAYRATPVRRVPIPKPYGGVRPLGIAALEDKIVQKALVENILTPIYEEEFCEFSYGFRPARSAHDALDALAWGIERRKVNYIVDADIRAFFDTVDRDWLVKFLEHRIADKRVIRLIRKWLKVGVLEDGVLSDTLKGTPQGAVISPVLANIYLHFVLDLWFEKRWQPRVACGEAQMVRYADDFVAAFQHKTDAERFLRDLSDRLGQFGLRLHPDKTRLVEFGRFAEERRRRRGEGRPETFDFLGFTHYCRKTRKGYFGLGRKPIAKRISRLLKRVKELLERRMHDSVHVTGAWLGRVLNGWLNYYAVPTSYRYLQCFVRLLKDLWHRTLRRRSQKDRTSWERIDALIEQYWPKIRIRHPWPDRRRMNVMRANAIQGKSRMH